MIAGSGVDLSSVASILKIADGVILGTALKKNRVTTDPVDAGAVHEFMQAIRELRK